MTLQERMIAVYLRQAKLPPEEKEKLELFLGLLLETLEEEETWERKLREDAEQSRAEQSRAEQSRAEQSRARRRRRRPLPLAWIQKRPMGLQARRPRLSMA